MLEEEVELPDTMVLLAGMSRGRVTWMTIPRCPSSDLTSIVRFPFSNHIVHKAA